MVSFRLGTGKQFLEVPLTLHKIVRVLRSTRYRTSNKFQQVYSVTSLMSQDLTIAIIFHV